MSSHFLRLIWNIKIVLSSLSKITFHCDMTDCKRVIYWTASHFSALCLVFEPGLSVPQVHCMLFLLNSLKTNNRWLRPWVPEGRYQFYLTFLIYSLSFRSSSCDYKYQSESLIPPELFWLHFLLRLGSSPCERKIFLQSCLSVCKSCYFFLWFMVFRDTVFSFDWFCVCKTTKYAGDLFSFLCDYCLLSANLE